MGVKGRNKARSDSMEGGLIGLEDSTPVNTEYGVSGMYSATT